MRRSLLVLTCLLVAAGCGGEPSLIGLEEPIRVTGATFHEGELPGRPPGSGAAGPRPTVLESVNNVLRPGQGGKTVSGRTTADASAVALRLEGLGTGFWTLPVGAPDPQANGELTFSVAYDVAPDAKPGPGRLLFAAVDEAGRSGEQAALDVCIAAPIPDNLNACDPKRKPPAAVLSLAWDTGADVDLVLVTPAGKIVDAKHPSTAASDGTSVKPDAEKDGILDRDANAACAGDRTRRENVVWKSKPAPGTYLVYANLWSACGEAGARFVLSLYLAEPAGNGNERLVEKLSVPGRLIAEDANGGSGPGLYVTAFSIQ
jgi:hypothetical protein